MLSEWIIGEGRDEVLRGPLQYMHTTDTASPESSGRESLALQLRHTQRMHRVRVADEVESELMPEMRSQARATTCDM